MLRTVEAEIRADGTVTLLEPVEVKNTTRALVTVLENGDSQSVGNSGAMLEFLQNNRLPLESRFSEEEIEAQILENRNSWD